MARQPARQSPGVRAGTAAGAYRRRAGSGATEGRRSLPVTSVLTCNPPDPASGGRRGAARGLSSRSLPQRSQPTPPATLGQVPRLGRGWRGSGCPVPGCSAACKGVTRSSAEARGQPEDADQATMGRFRRGRGGVRIPPRPVHGPLRPSLVRGFSGPRPDVLPDPPEPANSVGLALHPTCLALRPGSSPPPPAPTAPLSRCAEPHSGVLALPRRRGSGCPVPGCSAACKGVTRSSAEARGQPEDADQATMGRFRRGRGGVRIPPRPVHGPLRPSLVRGFSGPRPDVLPDPPEPANSVGLALHPTCLALRPGSSSPPPAPTAPLSRCAEPHSGVLALPRRRGSGCPVPGCSAACNGVTRSSAEARGQPEDADQATMGRFRRGRGGVRIPPRPVHGPLRPSLVRGFSGPRPDVLPDPPEPANSVGLALHPTCLALRPGSSSPPPAPTAPLSRCAEPHSGVLALPRRRGSGCPVPGCSAACNGVTRSSAEARGQPEDADQATMGRFRRGRGVSGYHLALCTAHCGRLSCVVSPGPGPMCCLTLLFPASRCFQTTPSRVASACLARMPVSARCERRRQRRQVEVSCRSHR